MLLFFFFFFSSRRRHTRYWRDWSSDVCSSDLQPVVDDRHLEVLPRGHLPRLRPRTGRDHPPPLPGERPPQMQPLLVVPYDQQNGPVQDLAPTSRSSPLPPAKYIHKNVRRDTCLERCPTRRYHKHSDALVAQPH